MPPIDSDSKLRASVDRKNASDAWLGFKHLKAITKEDLRLGTGAVCHVTAKDWWNGSQGVPAAKEEGGTRVMWIGQYKGKTRQWIRENNPSYDKWASENIKGYGKL